MNVSNASNRTPTVFGPYRILSLLGQGAYSEIFRVEKEGRISALKRNKSHYRYDRAIYPILDQEAEVLKNLKGSPYFPEFFNSGIIEDWHFLEMECIEGLSLFELVDEKGGCLAPGLAAYIAREAARGLIQLHAWDSTVHGDIKLENIMVDKAGGIKILDLGLSGGTLRFMPLERLHEKKITPYSDIYALGQVLYEITHGKHLFQRCSRLETYVKMRELKIQDGLFRSDLPQPLKRILIRCLKQDDEDRFQKMEELDQALSQYLAGEKPSIGAKTVSAWVHKIRRPKVEILPIGDFLEKDSEGNLVNEAAISKIVSPWKEAVQDLCRAYIENLGPSLHSIYLRGSIAKGKGIPGISDVDTFAVCQGPKEKINDTWGPGYYSQFLEKFPFANGLDIQFIHIDDLFMGLSHFSYRFIIKTLAVCIHGPDLAEKIRPFKPSLNIAFFYHGNLREVLSLSTAKLNSAENAEQVRLWSNYALRRILRLGFAINIEKENQYTRDLFPCYQVFAKYYPEQEAQMRQALDLTLNPPTSKEEVLPLLRDFGEWLATESEKIFRGSINR